MTMPNLDRRVTLSLFNAGGYDSNDEYQAGVPTEIRVWAKRTDTVNAVDLADGGVRTLNVRAYRLRWRADVVNRPTVEVKITDGARTYNVADIREPDPRDRFMDLEVASEVS